MWKWLVFLFCASVAAGCATTAPYTAEEPGGKRLYRTKCTSCHKLIAPGKHSDEEWAVAVERYGEKINLTREHKLEILEYLQGAN